MALESDLICFSFAGSRVWSSEGKWRLKRYFFFFNTYLLLLFVVVFFFLQLERSYQRFTAFYASRHSGRKLTWLYQLSKGELVTNCFKNRYTLQVRKTPCQPKHLAMVAFRELDADDHLKDMCSHSVLLLLCDLNELLSVFSHHLEIIAFPYFKGPLCR